MNIQNLTLIEARKALDAGEYTAEYLTKAFLEVIAEKNPELNAYLEVFEKSALNDAQKADRMIKEGEQQELTGIPIAIKDNILIKGKITSSASKILENYVASYDASVIEKLKKQGVVILGRTNMDEFAMGSSTENSAFGPTRNPYDTSRVPGGSSGGSVAAVAAGLALVALGSDTGGSVRQPASLCGVVGVKSTYGTVSRYGLTALGSSLDQIGPVAKTVADAEILLSVISGHDKNDSTSLPDNFFNAKVAKKIKTIGVPRHFMKEGIDKDVLANFERSLESLESYGYEIKEIKLSSFRYALAAYYIIMPAEASSNLARLDGMRYGLQKDAETFNETFRKTRGSGFGKEARRRILIGTYVLSSGYYEAYYNKAIAVRKLIRDDLNNVFEDVDIIATPTSPEPAFKIGEKSKDPLAMYAADIFTVPVSIAGVPAISVPAGTVERDGKQLPTGLQLIASYGNEDALFNVGKRFESGA